MPKNMRELRAAVNEARPKMMAHDREFLSEVEEQTEGAKHPADLRRVRGKVVNKAKELLDSGKTDQATMQVVDGYFAMADALELQIAAMADGDRAAGFSASTACGWHDADTGKPIRVYAPNESIAADMGGSMRACRDGEPSPASRLSVGQYVQALIGGSKRPEIKAALSEGDNASGGYSIPTIVLPQFIDRLRSKTRFIQAGARTLMLENMQTRIMRIASDPTATWRAENSQVTESAPTFDAITFVPKSLAVLVKVSTELLQDSANAADALETAMVAAMALELDRVCFFGSGASNQPLGLDSTRGINTLSMGANGASINWDNILDAVYQNQLSNAGDATALVSHPRTMRTLNKLKDGQGRYLEAPEALSSLPRLDTTSFPIAQTVGTSTDCATAHVGDFTQAFLGLRQQLTVLRLEQAFADHLQVGFLAFLRADVGFAHPQSFCQITGIRP